MRYLISLSIVAVLGAFFVINCGDSGVQGGPTTNDEFNEVLDGLGFNTDIGPPVDLNGDPLGAGYHPLGSKFAAFNPQSELYVAGLMLDSEPEHLFDDSSESYDPLDFSSKADSSWTQAAFKNGIGADVDGDGLDEFLVVYYVTASTTLKYILVDPDEDSFSEGVIDVSADHTNLDGLVQPAMAAGDFDGDDQDEIFVGFSKLYIIDDLGGEPTVAAKGYPDQSSLFVAAGNLDLDAEDEVVVTYTVTIGSSVTGKYEIFDGSLESAAQQGDLTFSANNQTHTATNTQVAIGDVDGDRLGEIVYFGHTDGANWNIFLMELQGPDETPAYDFREFIYQPPWRSGEIPKPLMTVDTDGDKIDEIFAHHQLLKITTDPPPDHVALFYDFTGTGRNYRHRITAADMDGDGREDLIYEWNNRVTVHGLNSLDVWSDKTQWLGEPAPRPPLILATGNVDNDSAMVRYDGDYELLFTDPTIVAVMASPPYQDGISQVVDDTTSTFGKVEGTTVEEETAIGFSTGFSVGYEADFGIFGGAEFSVSVEQSLDFTATQSATIEKHHAYTSGPGEDKVVFSTVPFDVYYYTIVSSPAPEDVGRTVTINIPREIQTVATSTQFFNDNNGLAPDVDEEVLGHTPGQVASYPSADDKLKLLREAEARESGYKELWNGPRPVSEGSGFDTIGISTTEGSGRGASMDVSVTTEFSTTSPGGAKVGGSVGFHYGQSYSVTTEDTAFFEGTVGNIPAASYAPPNIYKYGLMVYPKQHGGQKFVVMNYWVE